MERILVTSGFGQAYFYEPLTDFDTVRLVLRLQSVLLARRVLSFPSVVLGFEYFDTAYRTVDGRLSVPTGSDPYRGRHYAVAIDCERNYEIAFWGWNPDWGDGGRGFLSRDYFEAHVDLAMVRWFASGGPSRAFQRCLDQLDTQQLPKNEHLAHCWPIPNSFQQGTEQINGTPHTVWAAPVLVDTVICPGFCGVGDLGLVQSASAPVVLSCGCKPVGKRR
jgi:hypothetical protein